MTPTIKIKEWSIEERPREKMLIKGVKALNNSELIAIILRSGGSEQTAVDLAKTLLHHTDNSLKKLSELSIDELCSINGVGLSKAASIIAAFELGQRISAEPFKKKSQVTCASDAVSIMRPYFSNLKHEECWAMYLNVQNKVLHIECISKGGISETVIDAKIIIKKGVEKLAKNVIIFHNHPSGNPMPGRADIAETKKLRDALAMIEISLMDHIILADNNYYSFSENTQL